MASIPPIRKIIAEDFKEQASWLPKLLSPLNQFFESVTNAFNRSLTLKENLAADIITVEVDGSTPHKLAWSLKTKPVAVLVGNAVRSDGADFDLTTAVGVQWQYNQAGQLQIDTVVGLDPVPSGTNKYKLTLVCFTG